jgi:FkbM family methyltransferase
VLVDRYLRRLGAKSGEVRESIRLRRGRELLRAHLRGPRPRQTSRQTSETGFIDDVLRAILANRGRIIDGPIIDRCRFPTETFEPSSPSSILEAVAHLLDRRNEYERAANLFADEESVSLYRELLIFRALGPIRYALPLSTPGYINLYREEQAFRIAGSTRPRPPWRPLSIFRVEFLGHPIELEVWDGDLTAYFSLRQYFFDRGGVRIQPDRGDVVLDLGACLGDPTLGFAAAVGRSGRVFAFEPMPVFQEVMRSNVERNPQLAARIELVERAVSSTSDQPVRLVDAGPGSRMSADGTVEAMTVSIDDFVRANGLERVDFIKMDVEGAEQLALKGSAHSIASHQPKLAICAYHEPDDLWQIPLVIARLNPGYRLYLDHYSNHLEETVIYAA